MQRLLLLTIKKLLGIFITEDNMGYVINLDEFNTYKDNIDFVCEEECNG